MKKLFSILCMSLVMLSAHAEEPMKWGYYTGEYSGLQGVGVQAIAAYAAGFLVPADEHLNGSSIVAFNVPFQSLTNLTNVSVWVADPVSKEILMEQTVTKEQLAANAYAKVALTEPYTITSNVLVGYSFAVSKASASADQFPVLYGATSVSSNAMWLGFQNNSTTCSLSSLEDYTGQFGALGLNIDVEGANYADYDIAGAFADDFYTTPGTEGEQTLVLSSNGKKAVSSVELEIHLDGKTDTKTLNVTIPGGINQAAKLKLPLEGPAELGDYEVTAYVKKVNGEPNSKAEEAFTATLHNVDRIIVRRAIMEEFTGTGCGYCPRGIAGMKLMREVYGDRFIGIALHWYNSNDPMYNKNYASLSFGGAPSCRIDRGNETDPYYGDGNNPGGIADVIDKALAKAAEVDIELTAAYTDETCDSVVLTANTTAIVDGTYKLFFVLTADSLQGSTSSWKQSNYYASNSAGGDENMAPFCKNGEYGKSSFFYPFEDVMIGSSFKSTSNKAPELGALAAGESKEISYTVALPTKAALREVVNNSLDKVFGIAVVTNSKNKIANAIRVHIDYEYPGTALENVSAEAAANKTLENGQMVIVREGKKYNVQGMVIE